MLAKIGHTRFLAASLNYNEKKVQQGRAECIHAENFLKDKEFLSHEDKLAHFNKIISLNETTKRNGLHISLSFHSADKLSNDQMQAIARKYMQKIGLQEQPFLVYRHHDTRHPHMHLVSTSIKMGGDRICLREIFYHHSRAARMALEEEYSLNKLVKRIGLPEDRIPLKNTQKLHYGESGTIRSISNVIKVVMTEYKYTTLDEYNAVLGLYNVTALKGLEGSRMYKYSGLLYSITDDKGQTVSTPIKASYFYQKPTFNNLKRKFDLNERLREPHAQRVRAAIDWTLFKGFPDLEGFRVAMEKERISVVTQRDKEGSPQAIYYIDHKNRTVFDGTSLGEKYQVQNIRERCVQKQELTQVETQVQRQRPRLDLY